ncbi:OmpA family protein [Chryseobacterium gotjawalense]|uniref:OmpA family protein n=1 Tax=Chryseobacterium gotjawalense TaxID=3042315 RepID=A0ABY8REL6_9FLAO|nr:OmpA family protein [Chryseobacterium sp. wdc7]WHF51974.1 OmpA family protein [Chryseobacterium sp. wdc7]
MKHLKLASLLFLIGICRQMPAQTGSPIPNSSPADNSGVRVSLRAGYDFPTFRHDTPFIDLKGGFGAGASLDYYWNWFGIGGDFDYIQNKPRNTFPTVNLITASEQPISSVILDEHRITRLFYGIGPDFRFLISPRSDFELKLRAGLSSIKGGETRLTGFDNSPANPGGILLNYHGGFDEQSVFAGKASLQFNIFFSNNVGFTVGGYYMNHFRTFDARNTALNVTDAFYDINPSSGAPIVISPANFVQRVQPEKRSLQSFGIFAGLVFKFNKKTEQVIAEPTSLECVVTVMAKDKYSQKAIPNTDIILLDEHGNTIQNGVTDQDGSITFSSVVKGNYMITGNYQGRDLNGNMIDISEFGNCTSGGITKEILLVNDRFTVMGTATDCKTAEPIGNAMIMVKNNSSGYVETVNTDLNGGFSFTAMPQTSYTVYGKKSDFMSQTVTLNTNDYTLSDSQTIPMQICMDKAGCNDSIILKNILYDFDKSFIREDAKPELNRLVQFMKDNSEAKVELSAYTDSRGSNAYNMKLSQRRAESAVEYIISRDISRSRLVAKGYGDTHLLNKCAKGVPCTEAEHQVNRRTQMKVICPNAK